MIGNKKSANRYTNYSCENCNYNTCNKSDLDKHNLTAKHKRKCLEIKNPLKSMQKYFCEKCDYKCSNKKDFNKHTLTDKCLGNSLHTYHKEIPKKVCNNCNKEYLNSSGLWKHKKICQVLENKNELTNELREPDIKNPEITINLVLDLIKFSWFSFLQETIPLYLGK